MTAWDLTEGLKNLRTQVNERWPNRDKKSDGTIGDTAHQAETSGHNPDDTAGSRPEWDGDADSNPEVRAWDMDSDLGESGTTAQMLVDHLVALPGFSSHCRYMIYNRFIYSASTGFAKTKYNGASAHTEHIHFSGTYSQAADQDTSFDYKLEEVGDMSLSDDDKKWLLANVPKALYTFDPGKDKDGNSYPGISDATYPAGGNGTVSLGTALSSLLARQKGYGDSDRASAATLLSAVQSASGIPVDVLAAALVPALSTAILAGLPEGEVSDERLENALRNVLIHGTEGD